MTRQSPPPSDLSPVRLGGTLGRAGLPINHCPSLVRCPTYHRASDSVPVPRGEGAPRMVGTARFGGRVSSWPEVWAYRRASLPLRFGEVRPKGSTFSLHPARRSVWSPRWSAIFQSSEASGLPRLIITLKPLLRSSFVFWCCVLSSQGSSQVSAKVFWGSSFVEVVLRRF